MQDRRCIICKYHGKHFTDEKLHRDVIFRERGTPLTILLCYHHSWELFRMGQRKFLALYRNNFHSHFGTDSDKELIEYMKGEDSLSNFASSHNNMWTNFG